MPIEPDVVEVTTTGPKNNDKGGRIPIEYFGFSDGTMPGTQNVRDGPVVDPTKRANCRESCYSNMLPIDNRIPAECVECFARLQAACKPKFRLR